MMEEIGDVQRGVPLLDDQFWPEDRLPRRPDPQILHPHRIRGLYLCFPFSLIVVEASVEAPVGVVAVDLEDGGGDGGERQIHLSS